MAEVAPVPINKPASSGCVAGLALSGECAMLNVRADNERDYNTSLPLCVKSTQTKCANLAHTPARRTRLREANAPCWWWYLRKAKQKPSSLSAQNAGCPGSSRRMDRAAARTMKRRKVTMPARAGDGAGIPGRPKVTHEVTVGNNCGDIGSTADNLETKPPVGHKPAMEGHDHEQK